MGKHGDMQLLSVSEGLLEYNMNRKGKRRANNTEIIYDVTPCKLRREKERGSLQERDVDPPTI